jgi:hypothetical protein
VKSAKTSISVTINATPADVETESLGKQELFARL